MTSALVVALLLSASPESGGHAALVKARQTMVGDTRLPWLLLASGSISDENGKERRFVVEWEPCRARWDVRGHLLVAAKEMLQAVSSVICGNDPLERARVERNGTQTRYVWTNHNDSERVTIEVDAETGILSRAWLHSERMLDPSYVGMPTFRLVLIGTAEFSNFEAVGSMRLPRRMQLRAGKDREDWTIERIEIVPLP